MLKETPEWNIGRRGEILQLATLTRFGFQLIDVGGSTNDKAPFLHGYDVSFVAPDAMAFKTGQLWMEFKTKAGHTEWRGGSRHDNPRIPARTEQGIDRGNYEAYLKVQAATGKPVVLMVLAINEGELLGNTLRGLGEPRRSTNPCFDLVSWDIWKFRRICTFDCAKLRRYFFDKHGTAKQAPKDMPSRQELKQLLDVLKPQQGEFDLILMDIISQIEKDWHNDD